MDEAEPFAMTPLGVLMESDPGDPREAEGVLNPAVARGPDGQLYLFPRLVAKGNYSRIGIARVRFDDNGDPAGIERLGVALEPSEPYERNSVWAGCEDPRVTYLEPFQQYVMTYTALTPDGPRIAVAASRDLFSWERLGLVRFICAKRPDFNGVDNKDALVFPSLVPNPHEGTPSIGLIHRPLFPGTHPEQIAERPEPRKPRIHHESLWISYCGGATELEHLREFQAHHRLMSPRASWERIKVGGGVPPIPTKHGWLVIYHGVYGRPNSGLKKTLRYSAGALVLDLERPEHIRYRSPHPVLTTNHEVEDGLAPHVVFPTGADRRTDLGKPERIDVYYGVADERIGVATLTIPDVLPEMLEHPEARRDAPRVIGHR